MKWKASSLLWKDAPYPPRAWQAACLPQAIAEVDTGDPVVIQAVMGSGKTALIAELIAHTELAEGEHIVVTTTSQQLVHQLFETIGERVGFARVGRYFSKTKNIHAPILVTCTPSAPKLAMALKRWGQRTCALWVADEVHRTECNVVKSCYATLRPARAIGFTATPFRGKKTEELSLWRRLIFAYGPHEALRDGVVVPWKIVPWVGAKTSLDEACVAMIQRVEGSGLVSASSIDDAERFAALLNDRGVRASTVHSRLGGQRITERLRLLESGRLDAIVHVSLLQEGVDLPWLRWLCLRRPVRSSVRFVQEVGRVLRASEGKCEALLLDPNDLFATHRLTHEAVLQGMSQPPEGPTAVRVVSSPPSRKPSTARQATPLNAVEAYLRNLTVALSECASLRGRARRESPSASTSWRSDPATDRQRSAIEEHAWMLRVVRGLPEEHRKMLRLVYQRRADLRKGACADFLDVMFSLPTHGWPHEATRLVSLPFSNERTSHAESTPRPKPSRTPRTLRAWAQQTPKALKRSERRSDKT